MHPSPYHVSQTAGSGKCAATVRPITGLPSDCTWPSGQPGRTVGIPDLCRSRSGCGVLGSLPASPAPGNLPLITAGKVSAYPREMTTSSNPNAVRILSADLAFMGGAILSGVRKRRSETPLSLSMRRPCPTRLADIASSRGRRRDPGRSCPLRWKRDRRGHVRSRCGQPWRHLSGRSVGEKPWHPA